MVSGLRAVVVLSLILLSIATAVPALAVTDAQRSAPQPQTASGDGNVTETLVIDLQKDGDARWTIRKRYNLTSRNETAAFDELATDFENGNTDDLGLSAFRNASALASASTGREMEITNVTRDSERTGTATNGTGTLSISFTWTSFGRVEGDRFYVDDVFVTEQGLWLERLDSNQRLVIRPPDGYEFFDAPVPVTLRNGTIQWTGPQEFQPDSFSATFEETQDRPSSPPANNTTTTAPTPADDESDSSALLWVSLLLLGVGVVAVVGYLFRQQGAFESDDDDEDGPAVPAADGSTEGAVGAGTAGSAGAEQEADDEDEAEDDTIDVELLSDEERVERLLEQNGGRMKQANIVKETGWSNAKVSQLLSAMEEEDRIDKLRIGRENLISFPDEDVAEFDE